MPQETQRPRLAVLIDGQNISHTIAAKLFLEVSKIGDASLRRVYGDFSGGQLKGWSDKLEAHGMSALHQPSAVKGKNASDIALIVDAMDLLLKNGKWLDGFCIVSSDSDFTRLAVAIRDEGREVFGFGGKKTPVSFRNACTSFQVLDITAKTKTNVDKKLLPLSLALPIMRLAVEHCSAGEDWVEFSKVANYLGKEHPDLRPGLYGSAKLSGLFAKSGAFEFNAPKTGPMKIRCVRQSKAA